MTEEALTGGSMSSVARVGDTVRRGAGPWTPQVQRLLAHLRASGIDEVPAPLGFDAQGREVLGYLPGMVGHHPLPPELRTDAVLCAAARLLRRLHDAARVAALDAPPTWFCGWQAAVREPMEVICHGDFAPYNCVFRAGQLVGVIDFDHAHPGPRAWDLAYALYRFVPIMHPSNPESRGSLAEQCRRARLFCDAYGLENRDQLPAVMHARIHAMAEFLRRGAAVGDERMLANIAEGHLAIYTTDLAYWDQYAPRFAAVLTEGGGIR
ncbi:MAG: aminoglycoside phosphotransferase family protein [Anaerolineae bacterium]|nr:aminoglycoside phosphotransferase family protein [Anaerolineae bacterium]